MNKFDIFPDADEGFPDLITQTISSVIKEHKAALEAMLSDAIQERIGRPLSPEEIFSRLSLLQWRGNPWSYYCLDGQLLIALGPLQTEPTLGNEVHKITIRQEIKRYTGKEAQPCTPSPRTE